MVKTMANIRREAYKKKQEEAGKRVIIWIFSVLGVLAVAFFVYAMWLVS